jgi:hypothetical protein
VGATHACLPSTTRFVYCINPVGLRDDAAELSEAVGFSVFLYSNG